MYMQYTYTHVVVGKASAVAQNVFPRPAASDLTLMHKGSVYLRNVTSQRYSKKKEHEHNYAY